MGIKDIERSKGLYSKMIISPHYQAFKPALLGLRTASRQKRIVLHHNRAPRFQPFFHNRPLFCRKVTRVRVSTGKDPKRLRYSPAAVIIFGERA